MCGVGEQMRKKQQRLLKNMDAHKVMLDLLQIPYDKVPAATSSLTCTPEGRTQYPSLPHTMTLESSPVSSQPLTL